MLQNEHSVTRLRGVPFAVVGVDDGATRHDDAPRAGRGIREGQSQPGWPTRPPCGGCPSTEIWICFSGLFRQPHVRGLYGVSGNQVYVNRGLGFGTTVLAPRLNSRPEVSLFTLRRAPEGSRVASNPA
jgi:uncharacterized protein